MPILFLYRLSFRLAYIFSYNLFQFCGHTWILANTIARYFTFGKGKVYQDEVQLLFNSTLFWLSSKRLKFHCGRVMLKECRVCLCRCLSRHLLLGGLCDESVSAALHPGALPHRRRDWESQTAPSLCASVYHPRLFCVNAHMCIQMTLSSSAPVECLCFRWWRRTFCWSWWSCWRRTRVNPLCVHSCSCGTFWTSYGMNMTLSFTSRICKMSGLNECRRINCFSPGFI